MDSRKAEILRAIVEEYVATGQPVGSQTVARTRALNVSSATIRNDMTVLEREGYVTHPHTSAGRVPTDKGYRFFVDAYGRASGLPAQQRHQVSEFFAGASRALEEMLHETSQLLSRLTSHAAVVVGPPADAARVRSVQIVRLHENLLLVVAVLSSGAVEKESIDLGRPIDDARVVAATSVLDTNLRDSTLVAIDRPPATGDRDTDDLVNAAVAALNRRASVSAGEPVFVGGTSRIVAEHEAFGAQETVSRLLAMLEQQFVVVTLVRDLLDQGVTVRIGAENDLAELRECSVVLAPFDIEGEAAGTVGVLGPTRMDYPQAMSAVAVVSRRLGDHLSR
jgi:heat-inducible transcriptional repressor